MRLPKSKAVYLSIASALVIMLGAATAYSATYKTVTVQDHGQSKTLRGFSTGTVADFLKSQHVHVTSRDRVYPALDSSVRNHETIAVISPKTITINYEGKLESASTFDKTVSQLLSDKGITLNKTQTISVPVDQKLSNGETIAIHSTTKKVSKKTQEIPFQTIRRNSTDLTVGHSQYVTHGVKGLLQVQTTRVYRDGHKIHQTVAKKVIREPVDAIVEIGTAPAVHHYTLATRSTTPDSSLIKGSLTVLATAYTAGGTTASGRPAEPGVIAVDPSVIPLGTRVYIPGVGTEIAADTGGAIIGDHIDICMATEADAEAWGERTITIYILQ